MIAPTMSNMLKNTAVATAPMIRLMLPIWP